MFTPFKGLHKLSMACCLILFALQSVAQIFPVQVTVTSTPPRPIFLYKYTELGNLSLQTSINLTDFSIPQHRSRLKVSIEGAGIKIETNPSFIPTQPLILIPGVPTTLSGNDLQAFLKPENVNVFGIDKNAFFQSGSKLPEGFYSFCIEVLDYNSGEPISQKSCAFAQIFQEQPPRLLQPSQDQMVVPQNPQNVLFTWQPAPGGSPALTATSQYLLEIYQVIDDNATPANAVINGQAIIAYQSSTILTTNFNLDLTTTQLITGKTYVWRVRALDAIGQNVYFNDGFSEWSWFYYGYPTGGKIQLADPVKGYTWKKYEDRFFKWSASDKKLQAQPFDYDIKIVKVNDGQTLDDAMEQNSAFHQERMSTTQSPNGADYELTKALDPQDEYAWQVKAFTQGQEVAASEVWNFYGFPVVEKFNGGNFTVFVQSTENKDLNNLNGKGYIQLSSDENDTVSCVFTGIDLKEISGEMFMEGGEVLFDLDGRDPIVISPDYTDNPDGEFIFDEGKLTKIGLYFGGSLKIPFMHPTASGNKEYITTSFAWFQVDKDYELAGTAKIAADNEFDLVDPYNHKLILDTLADIQLADDIYTFRLFGQFILPDNIKTNDGERYILPLSQTEQLYYIDVDNIYANSINYLSPISNCQLDLKPKRAIVDLSEDKSPGKLSGDKAWKGVYFPEFKAVLDKEFDETGQFFMSYGNEYEGEQKGKTEFWTTAKGLNFKWDFKEKSAMRFNGFLTFMEVQLEVTDNLVQNSKIEGSIRIPFIDADRDFFYNIPITDDGVQVGYLEESLDNLEIEFAPFGGENKMVIHIDNAVFADNERLDCQIDVKIPALGSQAVINNIDDFRIYGDGFIGVAEKNGGYALDNPIKAEVYGYDIEIQSLEASYTDGKYALTYISTIHLGNDVDDGEGGPPLIAISSAQAVDSKFQPTTTSTPPIYPLAPDVLSARKFSIGGTKVHLENSLCELEGFVRLSRNDQDWGEIWKGKIDGSIKVPAAFPFEANIILNEDNDRTFWYFDAYFQDTEGSGVPFIEPMNLVGFEGRMYYNMAVEGGEFKPTFNDNYGAALYMQMIDRSTRGGFIQADVDAVVVMDDNDFTLTMEGDMSIFNTNVRKDFAGELATNAAAEVADEAIKAIGGIDESIDLSPGKVGIKVPDLSEATFYYEDGSFYSGLTGAFTGTPGVDLELKDGSNILNVAGDAAGQYSFGVSDGNYSLAGGYQGSSAANFSISKGADSLAGGFNSLRKTADFLLNYGGKKVALDIDAPNQEAFIELNYDSDKNLFGKYANNKGKLGFQYDNTIMEVEGDANAQIGSLFFESNGLEITGGINGQAGEANFGAKNSSFDLDLLANDQKIADLTVNETGGNKITGHADMNNQLGWGQLDLSDGKMLRGELRGDTGLVFAEVDGIKLGLKGNKTYTFGGVSYDDGSLALNVEGDMTNKNGKAFLSYSGNQVFATLETDSTFGRYIGNGYDVSASYYGPASGAGHFNDGTYDIYLKRLALENAGAFSFSDGNLSLSASANQMQKTGSFSFDNSSYQLNGYFAPDSGRLGAVINGDGFSAGGSLNGYADLSFVEGGKSIQVSGDLNQFIGSVSYDDGTIKLRADNNPITEVGKLTYEKNGVKYEIQADENVGTLSITDGSGTTTYSTNTVSASTAVPGGNVKVENGTIELEENGSAWLSVTKDKANFNQSGVVAVLDVQKQSTIDYQQYHAEVGDQGFSIVKADRHVKALKSNGIELQYDARKYMKMNFDSLAVNYDDYGLTLKETDLRLDIQAYQFGLGTSGLMMDLGDLEFKLGPQAFDFQLEPSKYFQLKPTSLDLAYDNINVGLDFSGQLNLSDGVRNLNFGAGNLSFAEGDFAVGYKNLAGNIPGITLNIDADSLAISPDLFAIKYDEIDLNITPNELVNMDILGRNLKIGVSELTLDDPELNLNFKISTGSEFLKVTNLSREFTMNNLGDIKFLDGDYAFTLHQNLSIDLDVKDYTAKLNYPDYIFKMDYSDWGVNFPNLPSGTLGMGISYDGIAADIRGVKNKYTDFSLTDSWGKIGFNVEANSNYTAYFEESTCKYQVKNNDGTIVPTKSGSSCANLPGFITQASAPEQLEGSKSIPAADSAQYMQGSVAEAAGGAARAKANFFYDSKTEQMIANAAVKAEGPFCVDAAMAFSSTPTEFDLDIGTKTQPVKIAPSCSGPGTGSKLDGYFHLDETGGEIATFISFEQSASANFGNDAVGAGLEAKIAFETGTELEFKYQPSIQLQGATMWMELTTGLYANYWFLGGSGKLTIAEGSLKGNMSARVADPFSFSGSLSGHIVILDLFDQDFSMSVSQDF